MHKRSNLFILVFLGFIWSSFAIFTKIAAENLSPFFIAFSRLALGGALLYAISLIRRKKIFFRKNFRHYLLVGFFNSALPFTLFALAAKTLDSGIVAILAGTIPMFEVLISILILRRHVDRNAIIGVVFGMVGVVITSTGSGVNFELTPLHIISVLAILCACISYASSSIYINSKCQKIDSMSLATGSVIYAALILSPAIFYGDLFLINSRNLLALLGLGLICTGIAYALYFKLAAEETARTVVSVVLLIPFFGTILGAIFLGESLTASKVIGCLTILVSMKFILNLSRKNFFKSKEPHAV
ncbi:MAG: DMT family transporter [Alphaproteobacteria bacterium]|nr:DMT family transporter [Alphaproteobacteria bacterium]